MCIIGIGANRSTKNISSIYQFNYNINWILDGILNVLFHISILASAFRKWQPVWEKLKWIQDTMGDESRLYRRIAQAKDW